MSYEKIFTYRGSTVVPFNFTVEPGHEVDYTSIIVHPDFNRLKNVGQLAPIDLIIPGAFHKRYEHCIGVFDLAQQSINKSDLHLDGYDKFLFMAMALLHDVGHGPYSHVYEIVAEAYGLPNHKQRGLKLIRERFEKAIIESAKGNFKRNHILEDLSRIMENKEPLARLISDKARLDKWDYTVRDWHYCQSGTLPDIETLITNLYFDGERSAIKYGGMEALRSYLDAVVANNKSIYINPDVETAEGFLIRAIVSAMDSEFDLAKGYSLTDEELNRFLLKNDESKKIFKSIRSNRFGEDGRWETVYSIRNKGYGWHAKENSNSVIVEEATAKEITDLDKKITLPRLVKLESEIKSELKLEPDELVITYSPQIDRLDMGDSNILTRDGNFRSIFKETGDLSGTLLSRLKEHYSIRLTSTKEKSKTVKDLVKRQGGLKKMLLEEL